MRLRIIFILTFIVALHGRVAAQDIDTLSYFDPNEVFVVGDIVEQQRLEACQLVAGTWLYDKPYVHADGATVVGKLGKPIAKSKIKKNLNKAYKKMKINKRLESLTLTEDGTWKMKVLGVSLEGSYVYDPEQEQLTMRWHGVPLNSHAHRDGKKLCIAFDMDRLLVVLHAISGIGHSKTLKSLSFLSENFRNVMVGFEMKPVKNTNKK